VRVINKVSQNLTRKFCCGYWGGKRDGRNGRGGLEVLRGFLNRAGVTPEQYIFYDGSGFHGRIWLLRMRGAIIALRFDAALGRDLSRHTPVAG